MKHERSLTGKTELNPGKTEGLARYSYVGGHFGSKNHVRETDGVDRAWVNICRGPRIVPACANGQ